MSIFAKIKALFSLNKLVTNAIKEGKKMDGAKPGWKTTEFWMTLAAQVGTVWASVQGIVPEKVAAIVTIIGAAVYTIARTVIKATEQVKAAKQPS